MNVDEKATRAAREQHEDGVKALVSLLRAERWAENTADRSGRWLTRLTPYQREMVRAAKDEQDPKRVHSRRRRKLAHASRTRNRRAA